MVTLTELQDVDVESSATSSRHSHGGQLIEGLLVAHSGEAYVVSDGVSFLAALVEFFSTLNLTTHGTLFSHVVACIALPIADISVDICVLIARMLYFSGIRHVLVFSLHSQNAVYVSLGSLSGHFHSLPRSLPAVTLDDMVFSPNCRQLVQDIVGFVSTAFADVVERGQDGIGLVAILIHGVLSAILQFGNNPLYISNDAIPTYDTIFPELFDESDRPLRTLTILRYGMTRELSWRYLGHLMTDIVPRHLSGWDSLAREVYEFWVENVYPIAMLNEEWQGRFNMDIHQRPANEVTYRFCWPGAIPVFASFRQNSDMLFVFGDEVYYDYEDFHKTLDVLLVFEMFTPA